LFFLVLLSFVGFTQSQVDVDDIYSNEYYYFVPVEDYGCYMDDDIELECYTIPSSANYYFEPTYYSDLFKICTDDFCISDSYDNTYFYIYFDESYSVYMQSYYTMKFLASIDGEI
jgi:hypothetical protein